MIETLDLETNDDPQQGMAPVIPLRRRIMSVFLTKYAAAAAVVLALASGFGLFNQLGESGVAWAEVLKQVTAAKSVTHTMVTHTDGESRESECRISSAHGVVQDMQQNGKTIMRTFFDPETYELITLFPEQKEYTREVLTEAEYIERTNFSDFRGLVDRMLSFDHKQLGQKEIDGVTIEGIESTDQAILAGAVEPITVRLWVNVETGLPVRVETVRDYQDGTEDLIFELIDFRWNVDLDPVKISLEVPADYVCRPDLLSFNPKEEEALNGLKLYQDQMGCFPKSLERKLDEAYIRAVFNRVMESSPGIDPREVVTRVDGEVKFYQKTRWFQMVLNMEQRDVAWYGSEVEPGNGDQVLWRWQLDDGNYRVIYGDLTAEKVSPELLAQLESE